MDLYLDFLDVWGKNGSRHYSQFFALISQALLHYSENMSLYVLYFVHVAGFKIFRDNEKGRLLHAFNSLQLHITTL